MISVGFFFGWGYSLLTFLAGINTLVWGDEGMKPLLRVASCTARFTGFLPSWRNGGMVVSWYGGGACRRRLEARISGSWGNYGLFHDMRGGEHGKLGPIQDLGTLRS